MYSSIRVSIESLHTFIHIMRLKVKNIPTKSILIIYSYGRTKSFGSSKKAQSIPSC